MEALKGREQGRKRQKEEQVISLSLLLCTVLIQSLTGLCGWVCPEFHLTKSKRLPSSVGVTNNPTFPSLPLSDDRQGKGRKERQGGRYTKEGAP